MQHRVVESVGLVAERLDGQLVILGRLRIGAELPVGVWHGEVGFLHGRIEQIAIVQLEPRCQRALVITQRRLGPANSQQRARGIGTGQPHTIQCDARRHRLLDRQPRETQRQIGLVAQCGQLFGLRLDGADRGQHRVGVANTILAHQCHAEIELRISLPEGRALPATQMRRRLVIALLAQQHVDIQMLTLRLELWRQHANDAAKRLLAAFVVGTRIPDFREVEPGAIAHADGFVRCQQALEAFAGLVVHAERQVQPARQQFSVSGMFWHAAPLLVSL